VAGSSGISSMMARTVAVDGLTAPGLGWQGVAARRLAPQTADRPANARELLEKSLR
jgi:hypothetical protein